MSAFVLIAILTGGIQGYGETTMAMQEFDTQTACLNAKAVIQKRVTETVAEAREKAGYMKRIHTVLKAQVLECVPKAK